MATIMNGNEIIRCPGCGLGSPPRSGPVHAYVSSSPACWAVYGAVLAREYEDSEYGRLHQVTVDAYAVQHPGVPERRSIQSVAVHLITLCLFLEHGLDPKVGPTLHKRLADHSSFHWLEPPRPNGTMTIADVGRARNAKEHLTLVEAWSRDIWGAWEPHHSTVREWIATELGASWLDSN